MLKYGKCSAMMIALLASAALGACATNDDVDMGDTNAATGYIDTATSMNMGADETWTPAHVLGYATIANMGEIQQAKVAQKLATNASVKAFARQMETDHTAMLNEGKQFATTNGVTPDTTFDEASELANDSRDMVNDLQGKSTGADWDEDYIEKQIDEHQEVLDKLQDAQEATNDAALRQMLSGAISKVQSHLDKAKQIKDKSLTT
jgi:putative membrane protein